MSFGHYNITSTGRSIVFFGFLLSRSVLAAIGCTLSNPAEDLRYLYSEMTSYKEDLKEFTKLKDGDELFKALKERLGTDLDPIYETYETPYTVYSVFKGDKKIGIVHGVNVPGKGGVIQVFLSMDPLSGQIRKFFFQRIESPAADKLKSKDFRAQYEGITLADFYKHDYYKASGKKASDRLSKLKPPAVDNNGRADYEATVRGIRKNLILLDFFVYGRKFEPFFEKAREMLNSRKSAKEKS